MIVGTWSMVMAFWQRYDYYYYDDDDDDERY